jgi:mono/diheme cytochrome c family protein
MKSIRVEIQRFAQAPKIRPLARSPPNRYEAIVSMRKTGCAVAMVILYSVLAVAGIAWAATPRGEALSQSWCSQGHAIKPNQSSANPAAPRFSDVAAEPSITGYLLRVFLKTPHSKMPNIMLKPEDMDDIVSYILSLKPRR